MSESGDGKSLARRMAEDQASRQKERRRAKLGCLVAIIAFIALIIGGRFAYRWAKGVRAGQFTKQGDQFTAAGKYNEAASRYRAALQLTPMGYGALRSAARLGSKINRPEAVDLWAQVLRLPQATDGDRQDYVRALAAVGKVTEAEPTLTQLLKKDPDTTTLLLAAQYAQATGDLAKAIQFARLAVKRTPDDGAARFRLAELLAASASDVQHTEARQILWDLAGKPGDSQGQALKALAIAPELTADERARVLQMLEAKGVHSLHDALLGSELRIQLHPEDAPRIYDQMVARWGDGNASELNELALWLNLHSQPERVLALLTIDRTAEDTRLIVSRLDALAALQRWDEIENFLLRPDLNLNPSILESFRARTAQEKGQTMDADVHWNHAISLAANDPDKLRFVAGFAAQSKAPAVALKAYEELAKIPQQAVGAYLATERMSAMNADTKVARDAAEKVAHLAPNDANAADQLAYLNLLLGQDVESSFARAKELAEKYPTRLSYRVTAALGYLRTNDPGPALAQFRPPEGGAAIDWNSTPAAWRAVYVAALKANDKAQEAAEILKTISSDQLNPEERQLIQAKKEDEPKG